MAIKNLFGALETMGAAFGTGYVSTAVKRADGTPYEFYGVGLDGLIAGGLFALAMFGGAEAETRNHLLRLSAGAGAVFAAKKGMSFAGGATISGVPQQLPAGAAFYALPAPQMAAQADMLRAAGYQVAA
jgi:hypothetical protein